MRFCDCTLRWYDIFSIKMQQFCRTFKSLFRINCPNLFFHIFNNKIQFIKKPNYLIFDIYLSKEIINKNNTCNNSDLLKYTVMSSQQYCKIDKFTVQQFGQNMVRKNVNSRRNQKNKKINSDKLIKAVYLYQINSINQMTQQLQRTSTLKMQDEPVKWGELQSLSKGLSNYDLKASIVMIGRNPDCTIVINDKRLSGKHCRIQKKQSSIILMDLSTNGTFIKDQKVGKGKERQLNHQDQIWLLPATKVKPDETFGFKIILLDKVQEKKKQQEKKKSQIKQENKKKDDFVNSLKQQITCAFCFQIMCIPVIIQPCNHRFCGGCLTDLVNSKKDTCIHCRKQITTAARDSAFTSIIDDYLKSHPEQKRDPADQQDQKKKNIFGHDPIDIHAMIHGKPAKKKVEKQPSIARGSRRGRRGLRTGSDISASGDQDDGRGKCRQCAVMRDGFQCTATQIHIACLSCGKLIARRDDPTLNQSCLLCTNYFCNMYYPPCTSTGVKLNTIASRKNDVRIDAQILRGNKFEFEALRNFLLTKKMTSKQLFNYMVDQYLAKDKFNYMFDRKIMKVPPVVAKQVKLRPESPVCDLCWRDVWFQMVMTYRLQMTAQMPSSVKDRPLCYWGVNCRTMDHNDDHAKRYNHMAYQTRF